MFTTFPFDPFESRSWYFIMKRHANHFFIKARLQDYFSNQVIFWYLIVISYVINLSCWNKCLSLILPSYRLNRNVYCFLQEVCCKKSSYHRMDQTWNILLWCERWQRHFASRYTTNLLWLGVWLVCILSFRPRYHRTLVRGSCGLLYSLVIVSEFLIL